MMMIQVKYLPNRTFKILKISDVVFLIFYIYFNFTYLLKRKADRDEREKKMNGRWGKKPQKRKLNSNCVSVFVLCSVYVK